MSSYCTYSKCVLRTPNWNFTTLEFIDPLKARVDLTRTLLLVNVHVQSLSSTARVKLLASTVNIVLRNKKIGLNGVVSRLSRVAAVLTASRVVTTELWRHMCWLVDRLACCLQGEMDRLMKETETLQHQAKAFKIDADQFAMALQQQQVSHVWTPLS